MSRLDEIKARLEAATPGPWEIHHDIPSQIVTVERTPEDDQLLIVEGYDGYEAADLEFIAHAPDGMGWLLDENARLRGLVDAVKELIDNRPTSFGDDQVFDIYYDLLNYIAALIRGGD